MKKEYTAPYAEKVNFNYNDQVVASTGCHWENMMGFTDLNCAKKPTGEGYFTDNN